MSTHSPEIFFMIGENHLIRAGGIGSFFKGFVRMATRLGWRVTCVLDREPAKPASREMMQLVSGATYVWPDQPLPAIRSDQPFGKIELDTAQIENFKLGLATALQRTAPDIVLVNTPEAVDAPLAANLPAKARILFYTHHENLIERDIVGDRFSAAFNTFLWGIGSRSGIRLATQSAHTKHKLQGIRLSAQPLVLPMPIPDEEVLQTHLRADREGVLFIGRFEPRKAPNDFVRKVKLAGLPARVLTNSTGKRKFEEAFANAGIANYRVEANLSGQAKADFIASSRIAFHPSKHESYGFCAMETLAAGLPTLCLSRSDWWRNFATAEVQVADLRTEAVDKLIELYSGGRKPGFDWVNQERLTENAWREYVQGIHVEPWPEADWRAEARSVYQREPQDYSSSPAFQNVALYLPAVSKGFVEAIANGPGEIIWQNPDYPDFSVTKGDLRFTSKESRLFYYPWCLYSGGQAADTLHNSLKQNWLTEAKKDPAVVVLGDSGGFQVQEGRLTWSSGLVRQMLEWLERVATHSMTLDFPTGGISRNTIIPHMQRLQEAGHDIPGLAKQYGFSTGYMTCLLQSEINLEAFVEQRTPGATKLLNVIQGRNEKESKFWYDSVKSADLEGWAFAGKHHTQLSLTVRRLIDMHRDGYLKKACWIHFLGISTIRAGVSLTFLQRALRKFGLVRPDLQISFDSSSPVQAAVQGYHAVLGWEVNEERWAFRPKRIALEEHVSSNETLLDLTNRWRARHLGSRHVAHTFIGANIPLSQLITARPGQLPVQTAVQSALLMHHNTQAYIEAFRAAYRLLEPAQAAERVPQLRYLDLLLDAIFEAVADGDDAEVDTRLAAASSELDAFMRT